MRAPLVKRGRPGFDSPMESFSFCRACLNRGMHFFCFLLPKDVFGSIVLVVVEQVRLAEFAVLMPTR